MNLARGAAEAVTRWTDAVTQLAGFVICQTCALPIWTQFRVAFALSLQKHDELAVVDACCLKHLKYNKQIKIKKIPQSLFNLFPSSLPTYPSNLSTAFKHTRLDRRFALISSSVFPPTLGALIKSLQMSKPFPSATRLSTSRDLLVTRLWQ